MSKSRLQIHDQLISISEEMLSLLHRPNTEISSFEKPLRKLNQILNAGLIWCKLEKGAEYEWNEEEGRWIFSRNMGYINNGSKKPMFFQRSHKEMNDEQKGESK